MSFLLIFLIFLFIVITLFIFNPFLFFIEAYRTESNITSFKLYSTFFTMSHGFVPFSDICCRLHT